MYDDDVYYPDEEDSGKKCNRDFSSYDCSEIFKNDAKFSFSGSCLCSYAQVCDDNEGLLLPSVFCSDSLSPTGYMMCLAPFILIYMVVLFRVLGSTAEEYFSPSLEMFSNKAGLPPRFAGVTLLALGNGAADVSATVAAIASGPTGYELSLGALTGAGVFVGTVVVGVVIYIGDGAKCRGALIRDVSACCFAAALVLVALILGTINSMVIWIFLLSYFFFVAVVLTADIYHRKVTMVRLKMLADGLAGHDGGGGGGGEEGGGNMTKFEKILEAFSNYENDERQSGWFNDDGEVVMHGKKGEGSGDGMTSNLLMER